MEKLGHGGDGLEYIPPVAATSVAVAGPSSSKILFKYIPKKTLLRQLQQTQVSCSIFADLSLYLN